MMAFGYTCSHSARAKRCPAEGVPLAESGRRQKLSYSKDGQAKRRFGGGAEQYVLDHPRSGRIASCRISIKNDRFQAENGHFSFVFAVFLKLRKC